MPSFYDILTPKIERTKLAKIHMNRERIYVRETFSMFIYSSIGI
jgi:hypothetical protein